MRISPSSGLADLDRVLGGIQGGDNVVWKVDGIESYLPFVRAFADHVVESGEQLVYFRFARHEPVLEPGPNILIHETHPEPGFESFITEIHRVIKEYGPGGCYVFDSLSDLSTTCYSDRMIGNFFRLTCPFLRSLDTIAFFAMYRYFHSYHAAQPITQTTQILIDVYSFAGSLYVQPSKVEGRRSPQMFMLHHWVDGSFVPVKSSAHIAKVIGSSEWPGLASASYRMIGVWDKTFLRAESVVEAVHDGTMSPEYEVDMFREVVRLAVSTDEHILPLAERYLTLPDVIHIWKRMIGTGMIGGKSVGMLLARAILCHADRKWLDLLEPHDSFYIGSDVFYTFLVTNDCWWERQRQKDPHTFLDGNEEVRSKMMEGTFPDYIMTRFLDMLEYFGQAPIIVRSSSLLEDNFGNAFSGKYESVFCANQGTREERLTDFLDAVRRIYASTISDEALAYRQLRGVLDRDEQMALLVQRVSGKPYGRFFFPQLAGVAYSFNPYAWSKEIVPEAGMLRLVFGLGTRAVDRSDDDYTRVVPLNAPKLRPDSSADDRRRHSQRKVDVLDLDQNHFTQKHFLDVVSDAAELDVELFASRDPELARQLRDRGQDDRGARVLALDRVLEETNFVSVMSELLQTIRAAYGTHVDVEFTANFDPRWGFSIHLLQCRPLQVQTDSLHADGPKGGRTTGSPPPPDLDERRVIMRSNGGVVGHSRSIQIDRIVYVSPERYAELPEKRRYALAKLIGRLVHTPRSGAAETGVHSTAGIVVAPRVMIMGPGRWGTSTPSLGIPVTFSEINAVSVICEIDTMHKTLIPDLSLGTHFFNDMVEMNILYLAYFGGNAANRLNRDYLTAHPHTLESIVPDAGEWSNIVFVREFAIAPGDPGASLYANAVEQTSLLYTTP